MAFLGVGKDFGIFRGSPSSLLCCLFFLSLKKSGERKRKKETLKIGTGGLEALLESKREERFPGGPSLGEE